MKKKIQVLIVDDHYLLRIGLANSLNVENDIACVGEAKTGAEAIELYRKLTPDIVLMDLRLPDMSGIDATAKLSQLFAGIIPPIINISKAFVSTANR